MPYINLGAMICEKLKVIYHNDKKWNECYKDVGDKFTNLKVIAKKFYQDKSEIEILIEMGKFSHSDVIDALGCEDMGEYKKVA